MKSDIGQADTSVTQDFDYAVLAVDSVRLLAERPSPPVQGVRCLQTSRKSSRSVRTCSCNQVDRRTAWACFPVGTGIYPYGSVVLPLRGERAAGSIPKLLLLQIAIQERPCRAVRLDVCPGRSTVDLNVAYQPSWADGLMVKVDVFNVFNEQEVVAVEDRAKIRPTGGVASTYLVPRAFQQPRYFRFSVQYDF